MPLTCRKCSENIKPAMIAVKVAGKEYHPACVSCHRCDRGLVSYITDILWGVDITLLSKYIKIVENMSTHSTNVYLDLSLFVQLHLKIDIYFNKFFLSFFN